MNTNNEIFIPMAQNKIYIYFMKGAKQIPIYTRQTLELLSRVTNLRRISIYLLSDRYETVIPKFHDPFLSMMYVELVRDLNRQNLDIKVELDDSDSIVGSKLLRINYPFNNSSDIYDDILSCQTDKLYGMNFADVKELVCTINFIGAELKAKSAIIVKLRTKPINFVFQRYAYQQKYAYLSQKLDEFGLSIYFDTQFNEPNIQNLHFSEPYMQPSQVQPQYYQLPQLPHLPQPQPQIYNFNSSSLVVPVQTAAPNQTIAPPIQDHYTENPAIETLKSGNWVPVFDPRNPVNPLLLNSSYGSPYTKIPEESPKLRRLMIRKRLNDEMDNTYGPPNKKPEIDEK